MASPYENPLFPPTPPRTQVPQLPENRGNAGDRASSINASNGHTTSPSEGTLGAMARQMRMRLSHVAAQCASTNSSVRSESGGAERAIRCFKIGQPYAGEAQEQRRNGRLASATGPQSERELDDTGGSGSGSTEQRRREREERRRQGRQIIQWHGPGRQQSRQRVEVAESQDTGSRQPTEQTQNRMLPPRSGLHSEQADTERTRRSAAAPCGAEATPAGRSQMAATTAGGRGRRRAPAPTRSEVYAAGTGTSAARRREETKARGGARTPSAGGGDSTVARETSAESRGGGATSTGAGRDIRVIAAGRRERPGRMTIQHQSTDTIP